MKNIFTKKNSANFIKIVAGAFKKLPSFVVYLFYNDKSFIINDTLINEASGQAIATTGCDNTKSFTTNRYISNDAGQNHASFSFMGIASSFKSSIMKSFVHYLRNVVTFIAGLPNFFLRDFFKKGFFKKRQTFKKMRVVHLNIQNSNTLPFNTHAVRNFIPDAKTSTVNSLFQKIRKGTSRMFTTFFVVLFAVAFSTESLAQTAGPNFPSTGTNSGGGGTAWSNPTRVTANDNSSASVAGTGTAFDQSLYATGYGFSIPSNATILGIQVTIGRYASSGGGGGNIRDNLVQLIQNGSVGGNNNGATTTSWPTSETAANYGSTTDLWGSTWTPALINASNFGVALRVNNSSTFTSRTAYVDYITVTVTYCTPPPTPGAITKPTNICASSTGNTFSISSVIGATSYTWSVTGTGWVVTAGGTTTSATITVGSGTGTVSVTANNTCGASSASTTGNLTPTAVPSQPSTVTGATTVCANSTQTYSVTNVAGVTYTWSLPSGWAQTGGGTTNSITVTTGTSSGTISVTPSNACGNGTARTLAATVRQVFTAGSISNTGQSICYNASPSTTIGNTTSASGGDGVITYEWQSSTDPTFTTGVTTISSNTSTYTPTGPLTTSTYYRRLAHDGTCNPTFTASSNTWEVTVNPIPTLTTSLASPQFYCSNQTVGSIALSGTPSGVVFDITGGSSAGLPDQTGVTSIPSFTTVTGPAFATITVTPRANGCTGTTPATYNVIVSPVPTVTSVTGPSPLCIGATQNYSAVYGGGSGVWSSSDGSVATVDPTSGDVTAVSAGTATITFTINGSCGNPSASQQVTVYDAPGIASQPTDQTVTYGDASASFSVVAEAVDVSHPAPTYQWQVNSGSGFNDMPGETSSTLTIANPTIAMSGNQYHVILTNSCFSTTSSNVSLTVNPLTVTVTADAGQTKVYGDSDPAAFTYTSSPAVGSTLANGDVISFTGALSRVSGEDVGTYAIGQNTLANSNYNIVYNADNFAITPLTVTVTADAGQTKVYGDSDPAAYTYTSSPAVGSALANGDVISFTGALSRVSGEDVGTYAIGQNTLANSNYNIVYNADNFAITPLTVTVTADAGQTKVYGDSDPAAYTYTSSPAVGSTLANGDVISFTGALSRVSGEDVGTYAIGQNTLANSNYNIVYNADNFAITPLTVTVTADAGQTKVYGDSDPAAYTYTSSPAVGSTLANGDVISFTGALSRVSGEDVGTYAIGQNTLANSNYNIVYNADNFAITPLTVTVTADAGQTKVYGDSDPAAYTYTSSPAVGSTLANGDVISFTGALSRVSGEDVGTYAIGQNTLANSNYNIVYNADNFAITPLTVTVTADAGQTKVYGDSDPAAYTYTSSPAVGSALANGDVISFTGALSRVSGEDVGTYAIGQNTLANSNYNIVYNADNFAITPLTVTVTADAGQSKTYGDVDPTFTYTVSPPLIGSDAFLGALSRDPGESAGTYAITLGTLALNSNYGPINFVGTNFTINNIPITASASAGIVPCAGGTSILTVTASGGDGTLKYSIDGGITYQPGNTFTVNAAGSPYVVTVEDADGFTATTNSVTVTEEPSPTISLSSGAESDGQAICIGNSIDDITYAIGGNTTGASVTALPSGLTGSFSGGVFTITGTPTAPGSYSYTVTTTGPCVNVSLSGTILVNDNATVALSSATGTDGQTVCINNNIDNITYSIGGGATDATVAGLPAGVTWTYSGGVVTIAGTPTVSGTFTYTVTTAGPCDIPTATGTITVNANSSLNLSSADETAGQTVCINSAITDIVYAVDDGSTGAGATGLPNGVTGSYDAIAGTFTITGTPTQPGTFTYTVTTTGPCQQVSLNGTISVNDNSTIGLSSATGTDGQTVCINEPVNNIVYATGGGATGASISAGALPDGVTGSYDSNTGTFTITGTPTESGTFNYTVTTTGPCNNVSLSGTISVNNNSTINLSSAIGTDGQAVCINHAITAITYVVGGGGTSATLTGSLPTGITGSFSGGVFTISGTATESGSFSYTVTSVGPCTNVSLSGTIMVNADATIGLSSGPGAQVVCINTGIIPVAYAMGGSATNISITAGSLPSGVTGSFAGGVFTISGTPTESGIFNYTVTTAGPCANQSLSGTITVNPSPVVNAVSNVSYCNNGAGAAISFSTPTPGTPTYNWTSTANVGFGTSGTGNIPAFMATNNSNSVITAIVTVTATTNGCPGAPTTFDVTVNPSPVVNPVSNLNYCNNGAGAGISFSSPITGGTITYTWSSSVNVGFGLNGNGNIGSFTAVNNSFTPLVATVTVTPSLSGCSGTPISFTVTVNPNANSGTISGSSTLCTGTTAQLSTNGSAGGTWTSSTPSIATVNANSGLVTAGSTTGSATIFYTVNNICGSSTSSFTVSVNPTAAAGTISGPNAVCAGSSVLLSSNGNSGGTWFSSNTIAATVNPSGFVTGVSAGTTTIYYYVVNSCGTSISAGYTVTVSAGGNPGTIIGSSSICAGGATLLLTTGSSGGTWASTNTAVAIVDGTSGFVIAQNPGTTTITYTVPSNSCSSGSQVSYFTLTVNPAGNPGTITGNSNICAGTSTLLSTTGTSGGTWLSGNTLVATVDPNTGNVTGVAPGAVIITYQISNSCGSGSALFPMTISQGANAGTISGSSSVCAGSAISLTSNGTPGGLWTSSNPAAATVDGNGVVLGTGAGNTTITYTVTSDCSSSSTSKTISVTALPNAGSVTGNSTVCAGLSTTFTSNGNAGGTWSSSNPAAATVNSASGVVTAVAAGNSTITYTVYGVCGTVSQSAPITVNPVLNAGMISGGSSVCVGSELNLSSNGNSGGSWTSSNTLTATIDGSGVVTSVAPGTTMITYTVSNGCGTSNATQLVTVNALANAGTVSGAATLCSGLSTAFTTTGTGGTWSSSNTAVATVNATSGLVTGVGAGDATITYTVTSGCGNASASAPITVNSLADAGTISGNNAVCVMSTINLSSNITGGTWGSNAHAIATVNSSGVVTGVAAGTTTITYTVTTTCGTNVASFPITVNAAPNAGMIPGTTTSVCVGSSIFLSDVGGMTGGSWRSVNPARASVDPSTGEVTGVSSGNTIIVYSVTNSCGTSTANLPITVNSLPNAGTISGLTSVCAGATINLSASGDAGGTWSSNAPGVATVNSSTGVVTGVAQGTTTIIYTVGSDAVCGTSSATYTITVNPLAVAGAISGTTTVCTGLSTTLTSNGAVGGTWSSSNPAVASVNSTSGVVIGVAAGSAVINYTVTNICGSTTASATVTVNGAPDPGTISGTSSVCVGSNINLSDNVSGGIWSSSTHSVATVGPNTGIVTGVAAGNTTITYTVTNSCGISSTTYAITVNPVPVAATITGTTYLCTGSTTTLSSNMTGGTWSSSNTAAATVDPVSGLVTGLSAGTTSISYTISTACGSATNSVVVTIGNSPSGGTVSGASSLCVGSTAIFASNGTGGGSWSSNNTAAATVDPITGVVTGVAAGSATISYTVSSTCGSAVSSSNITISALPNAGSVSGSSAICAGSTVTLTSNGTGGGLWSSNNNLVATVNSATGVVTGVAAGSATITYTVSNTCGIATATENVTISALPNSGIVSGAATLCGGVTTAFTSTGNGGGSWSSSNTLVATVDAVTGAVTGVAAGSATISYTVTSLTCGSSVSSANITINPAPDPGNVTGLSAVCAGSTITLTSDGNINGTWSSGNTSIATVDANGVVSGVAAGSTSITYTVTNGCGTAGATKIITVNPLANAGTVGGAATLCAGGATTTFTSNGLSGGNWSSDNTSAATVDAASGLVTGVSAGTANIIYTVTTPCGTATASAPITIIILPNAGAVSGPSTVCAGSTTNYTSNGLSGGTWSSATPSVATVDATSGLVTGVSAGNATITYTFTNSCGTNSASQMITVNALPNAGAVTGASTVCIGGQATFTSDGLSGGNWSSSNTAAATVDPATGVVTGISAGNTTITYTSNTPCGTTTASSDITVVPVPDAGTVSGNSTVCAGANTTFTSSGMIGGTWSSVTPSVATVDPTTGVVTGVSAGNATITYTFTNSCGTNSASQMITVNPLPNAGTLTGASAVCVGSQATFTSTGLSGGTWSTSNATVASVNPTTGVVMGVASGSATITYTSTTPCGTQTTTANITVNPVLSAGTVSGSSTVCIGSTTPYSSNGSAGGTWSSVTPAVASVNPTTGVVTGVSTGNATITYTVSSGCGTFHATKMIAVSLAANTGTINGPSSVCTGTSVDFTRSGGSGGGTWSSSNTSVATVNNSGRVTGMAPGTAVISYSVTSSCGTGSTTSSITVNSSLTLSATNINASTDPTSCSASVTLGSNVTVTGSPTLQYRIGFYPFFSFPISATHTFYRGTTPVIVIASNSCGTIARMFLVTVVDNTPPTITCVPNATRSANGHSTSYSVRGHEFDATATDGCGVASMIYSLSGATNDGFDRHNTSLNNVRLNVGTTTITWQATDVNGNVSTCTTQVTVTGNSDNHRDAASAKTEDMMPSPLTVKVAPNPTSNYFTLQLNSGSTQKINLVVADVMGRTVEEVTDILPNGTIQIGSSYHPGFYVVQAVQGNDVVVVKLIKEGK